ncbi:uncharacterized protein LOC62_07G009456 [Vanrija pseudolonga]|uniref:Uncharacterized protein n=1 Tax=Vanrija pseudolonga TaxID=143232 RepID=A0AAF0YG43_9TREE|nr:hypothetical protein LOC62_07G009456 [Vanrija pseudolonga]
MPTGVSNLVQATAYEEPADVGRVAVANTERAAAPILDRLDKLYVVLDNTPLAKIAKPLIAELGTIATTDHVADVVERRQNRAYSVLQVLPTDFEREIVQDYLHYLNVAHQRHDARLAPLIREHYVATLNACFDTLIGAHNTSVSPEDLKLKLWDICDQFIELINFENTSFFGEINAVRDDFEASLEGGDWIHHRPKRPPFRLPLASADMMSYMKAHAAGMATASDPDVNPFVTIPDPGPNLGSMHFGGRRKNKKKNKSKSKIVAQDLGKGIGKSEGKKKGKNKGKNNGKNKDSAGVLSIYT